MRYGLRATGCAGYVPARAAARPKPVTKCSSNSRPAPSLDTDDDFFSLDDIILGTFEPEPVQKPNESSAGVDDLNAAQPLHGSPASSQPDSNSTREPMSPDETISGSGGLSATSAGPRDSYSKQGVDPAPPPSEGKGPKSRSPRSKPSSSQVSQSLADDSSRQSRGRSSQARAKRMGTSRQLPQDSKPQQPDIDDVGTSASIPSVSADLPGSEERGQRMQEASPSSHTWSEADPQSSLTLSSRKNPPKSPLSSLPSLLSGMCSQGDQELEGSSFHASSSSQAADAPSDVFVPSKRGSRRKQTAVHSIDQELDLVDADENDERDPQILADRRMFGGDESRRTHAKFLQQRQKEKSIATVKQQYQQQQEQWKQQPKQALSSGRNDSGVIIMPEFKAAPRSTPVLRIEDLPAEINASCWREHASARLPEVG
eukprot:gene25425-11085_t